MSDVIILLERFGFPVVAYLLLFWLNVKIIRENTKAIDRLTNIIAMKDKSDE
jgi:hypothetical protein